MDVYEELEKIRNLYRGLSDRVEALEKKKNTPRGATKNWEPDPVAQKVLDLLHAVAGTGVRLNAGSIAGSIDSQIGKVGARLETLKRRKLVCSHKGDTGYEMYWVEPAQPSLPENDPPEKEYVDLPVVTTVTTAPSRKARRA